MKLVRYWDSCPFMVTAISTSVDKLLQIFQYNPAYFEKWQKCFIDENLCNLKTVRLRYWSHLSRRKKESRTNNLFY